MQIIRVEQGTFKQRLAPSSSVPLLILENKPLCRTLSRDRSSRARRGRGRGTGSGVLENVWSFERVSLQRSRVEFQASVSAVVVAAIGLVESDGTTFSTPSSTSGGDLEILDPDPEASCSPPDFAGSICPAISKRSRCSSNIAERSFLSAASYNWEGGQRVGLQSVFLSGGFLPASTHSGYYRREQ